MGIPPRLAGEKQRIKDELLSTDCPFSLLTRITLKDGEDTDLWSARDALVLKALAIVLGQHLPVSRSCTHIKGHGGAKYAVREVRDHLAANRFVLRTDVKSYYASIDHLLLLDQLAVHIKDRRVLNLIGQYLRRTSERGGSFWDYEKGISLGSPLSPLLGGFFLNALDAAAAKLHLFYVRFMDDILILAPTHWHLRRAVQRRLQTSSSMRLGFMSKSAARSQPQRHLRCTSGDGCSGQMADCLLPVRFCRLDTGTSVMPQCCMGH